MGAGDPTLGERALGGGIGNLLAMLKDRGELKEKVEWAGRTNDSKAVNIQVCVRGGGDVCRGSRGRGRCMRPG